MRILHTADWHLGKKLDFYSRYDEQKEVLTEIVKIAEEKVVDMILVAGDLFDTFNPPNEAAELLYKTLKKLSRNSKIPVVAIAGNHDSPDRINVADVLARENGIIFIGHPMDVVPQFELENGFSITQTETGLVEIKLKGIDFPVRLLHTAFANEVRLKEYFGEDKQRSLQESLAEKWKYLADKYCDARGVNLLVTHLYMMKRGEEQPEEPDGEKPLNIGNADVVYSEAIPPQIQYAALGHLHRYQNMGIHQPVIYSGSPLAYSFSESGQQKYVSLIEAVPGEPVHLEKIPLKSGKQLIRKSFDDVASAEKWLLANQNFLVELTLATDEFLKSEDRKRIMEAHHGIIHLIPKVRNLEIRNKSFSNINLNQNLRSLFKDYFKAKNEGQEPNEELMQLFDEILQTEQ